MKSDDELLEMLFARLTELQHGTPTVTVKRRLKHELSLLYDILDETVPEEYWLVIETVLNE